MEAQTDWDSALAAIAQQGWRARVVPVERLAEVGARVGHELTSGELDDGTARRIAADFNWDPEGGSFSPSDGRSGETRRPRAAHAALGRHRGHAAAADAGDAHRRRRAARGSGAAALRRLLLGAADGLVAAVAAALAPGASPPRGFEPPLKTLAACAGLARYGRNNIAYVPGLGSYLMLAACCLSDAPPPDDAPWGEPQELERCERCSACLRACPDRRHPRRTGSSSRPTAA